MEEKIIITEIERIKELMMISEQMVIREVMTMVRNFTRDITTLAPTAREFSVLMARPDQLNRIMVRFESDYAAIDAKILKDRYAKEVIADLDAQYKNAATPVTTRMKGFITNSDKFMEDFIKKQVPILRKSREFKMFELDFIGLSNNKTLLETSLENIRSKNLGIQDLGTLRNYLITELRTQSANIPVRYKSVFMKWFTLIMSNKWIRTPLFILIGIVLLYLVGFWISESRKMGDEKPVVTSKKTF